MFGALAKLFVEVGVDDKPLTGGFAKVRGQLVDFASRARHTLTIPFTIGAAVGGGAALLFLKDAATKAGDLNETLSKTRQVFGASAGAVVAQADEMARKFGLVKTVSLDAASNIGLVLKASGYTADAAAGLSNQLSKLAADASSFFNVPIADALEKIRAGLVGEAEPIRSFGVLLSEAAVQEEALRAGLIKTKAELNDQIKVQARANLILKGMADATGDLERTQNSYANQVRKMQGDIENFKASIGEELIPVMTQLIGLFNDLTSAQEGAGRSATKVAGETTSAWLSAWRNLVSGQASWVDLLRSRAAYLLEGSLPGIASVVRGESEQRITDQIVSQQQPDASKPIESELTKRQREFGPFANLAGDLAHHKATWDKRIADQRAKVEQRQKQDAAIGLFQGVGSGLIGMAGQGIRNRLGTGVDLAFGAAQFLRPALQDRPLTGGVAGRGAASDQVAADLAEATRFSGRGGIPARSRMFGEAGDQFNALMTHGLTRDEFFGISKGAPETQKAALSARGNLAPGQPRFESQIFTDPLSAHRSLQTDLLNKKDDVGEKQLSKLDELVKQGAEMIGVLNKGITGAQYKAQGMVLKGKE